MSRRILILGAAGRDFHDFNLVYRDDPAVEVVIDGTAVSGSIALEDLANAVQSLPKYGLGCTDKVDPNATP